MTDASVLVDDIASLVATQDPDALMLIKLATQLWLDGDGKLSDLEQALNDKGYTYTLEPNKLLLSVGSVQVRIHLPHSRTPNEDQATN